VDANRFDRISRSLAGRATRRRVIQGLGGGGLLAAALHGLGRSHPGAAAQGDDDLACVLDLIAAVRTGPSEDAALGGVERGELRGELRFSLDKNGGLRDALLTLEDGTELEATGQATGSALTVRIAIPLGGTLVLVGAGESALRACRGAVDGLLTGPEAGDLGDWHASASAVSGGDSAGPTATEATIEPDTGSGAGAAPTSPPDCLRQNAACDDGDVCCLGTCDGGFCPCATTGMVCAGDEECCNPASGPCVGGVCACVPLGSNCFPGNTDCCAGFVCVTGRCFVPNGGACTSEVDCVNYCVDGVCADEPPPPTCKDLGQTCQSSEECCVAYCDTAAGGFCTCLQEGDLCLPLPGGACCSTVCGADGYCTA
jgi:hypothetical protein